ncbi:MAG: prepilin-type N-terminal cleavage/methylation domain-containing protein [Isosphaeraceae bacterium]
MFSLLVSALYGSQCWSSRIVSSLPSGRLGCKRTRIGPATPSGLGHSPRSTRSRGFTLIELLVVIVIILITFVLLRPVLSPGALASHQAARLLHGALVAARDAAIAHGEPRGIRLVLDPAWPLNRLSSGQIDRATALCANRVIPIEPAADYSEGLASIFPFAAPGLPGFPPPYLGSSVYTYPWPTHVLMVEESPVDPTTLVANPPTSWFWNIRIGDQIRFGNAGGWYTVVGPMTTFNPELFVNCGRPGVDFPGTKSPLNRWYGQVVEVDFLFLVNGQDDDQNGFVDEGFDGVDNNGDGQIDEVAEWEVEKWPASLVATPKFNMPYTIRRRPVPSSATAAIEFPSNVVVDLSTLGTTRERSRLPFNSLSGQVDIMLSPRGEVIPTTIYSCPSSFGLTSAYLHFWLADRGDIFDPLPSSFPSLPLPRGLAPNFQGRELKGEITVLSLNARTGAITITNPSRFDTANVGSASYNPRLPFLDAEQGAR